MDRGDSEFLRQRKPRASGVKLAPHNKRTHSNSNLDNVDDDTRTRVFITFRAHEREGRRQMMLVRAEKHSAAEQCVGVGHCRFMLQSPVVRRRECGRGGVAVRGWLHTQVAGSRGGGGATAKNEKI